MRKVIIDERAMNPKYYDRMSEHSTPSSRSDDSKPSTTRSTAKLLDAAKQLGTKESDTKYPDWADNGAKRALVDFFFPTSILLSRSTPSSGTPSSTPGSAT